MMRGAAPVSAGASGELERLIAAITQRHRARARCSTPTATPARRSPSCARSAAMSAPAMSEYLDLVGCRLLDGFDISGRYALELPDALLRAIRLSVDGAGNDTADVDARIAGIRAQVPDEHRAEFDELLGEARLDVPPARRAGRVQRHLGVGHHAPRRARGRPPARGARAASTTPSTSSTPASTRCARW